MEKSVLEKIGFCEQDIEFIIDADNKYGQLVQPDVEEYEAQLAEHTPYDRCARDILWAKVKKHTSQISALQSDEVSKYTLFLLFWIRMLPCLERRYAEYNIPSDIMWEGAKDLLYKTNECKQVYGVCGVFTDWFFLMFELRLFAIGRLHYEIVNYRFRDCTLGGHTLKTGDLALSCHIPSCGPLLEEDCIESLRAAYDFFKPYFKDGIMPLSLWSWLLYPPYVRDVFKPDSNLRKFAAMFYSLNDGDADPDFEDCWRIFGKYYDGPWDLPTDNTLRKNMVQYLKDGGTTGRGCGVLFYDGKEDRIINKA